jgi:hypothetical protein
MHIECLFGLKLKFKLLKGYTPDKILEVKDIRNLYHAHFTEDHIYFIILKCTLEHQSSCYPSKMEKCGDFLLLFFLNGEMLSLDDMMIHSINCYETIKMMLKLGFVKYSYFSLNKI